MNVPIQTECTANEIDALLYTAICNEVARLANCKNKKERQQIRIFILSGYEVLKKVEGNN